MSSVKRKKVVRTRAVKAKKGLARKRSSFPLTVSEARALHEDKARELAIDALTTVLLATAVHKFSNDKDPLGMAAAVVTFTLQSAAISWMARLEEEA